MDESLKNNNSSESVGSQTTTLHWKTRLVDRFKELDPNGEILSKFDESSGKIDFSDSILQHQKQKFEDEAYVRVYLVLRLIKKLKYPPKALELEKKYSIGHPSRKGARLDILVKDVRKKDKRPFMLLEAKTPDQFQKNRDLSIKDQLFSIAKQEIKGKLRPKYLVYYTISIEDKEIRDKVSIIDFERHPTYEEWKDLGEPILDDIPSEYGIAKKYTYANIEKPDEKKGLKPLRKDYTLRDFEKLRLDLHNKLWAGGEADYNDIFYHLVKIMLVKVYDEIYTPIGKEYTFQVTYRDDELEKPLELATRLDQEYKEALRDLLNYDEEKIKEIPLIEKDKFTYEKLFYAVDKLQEISLTENIHSKEEDILGLFFESILQNEFKQSKGQYFTHKNIVKFLIYALELDELVVQRLNKHPPHFLHIIDPAAGSGTFLIEAMKIITREILKNKDKLQLTKPLKDRIDDLENPNKKNKWAEDYVYGIEPNARLGLATKLNMILHGDGNMNIFIEDGLMPFRLKEKPFYTRKWKGKDHGILAESYESAVYPRPINAQFDVVMSNPPFSMKIQAMRSYRYIQDNFLYWDSRSSENLFLERWVQLLKTKGRLGVVLPESIFDTKEHLYIRNFLYKYLRIKAVISLPQEAFEPYTSTKVSLLIAEKKSDREVKQWEDMWRQASNRYNKLRRQKIIQIFLKNDRLINKLSKLLAKYDNIAIDYSKVFVFDLLDEDTENLINNALNSKDVTAFQRILESTTKLSKDYDLRDLDTSENRQTLRDLLKEFYPNRQFDTFIELLEYVYDDVLEIAHLDFPNIPGQNNYCNSWWVFGEVSKHFDYSIFYAQAENIGYKRTKRRELDKDIPIKDKKGRIIAFKNDLFKVRAQKVKRQHWVTKGKKEDLKEREEIIKTEIIIDTKEPETILDHMREIRIWSDVSDFSSLGGEKS